MHGNATQTSRDGGSSTPPRRRIWNKIFAVTAIAGMLITAACGGGGSEASSSSSATGGTTGNSPDSGPDGNGRSDVLNIGIAGKPLSFDPAFVSNDDNGQLIMGLAYEPLIRVGADGNYEPGLATSWKYLEGGLTKFELTIRDGVKFSDGSPLTAQSVVDSIKHAMDSTGPAHSYATLIKTVTAPDDHTVLLETAEPNPSLEYLMTRRFMVGNIVGPKGVADPKSLGSTTDGAGAYMLDADATVTGDHYVFVPNPNYYDQSAIHFNKVNVRVIDNAQTRLSATSSGQIDLTIGALSDAESAESSGLSVYSALASFYGVFLFDREGTVVPALKDQRVRQALNYATNREGITQAIFGKYGEPNDEPTVPGYSGYAPDYADHYTYDIDKAKQLLADAGYPDGFKMTIGASQPWNNSLDMAQAIAGDWKKVGVDVEIRSFPDVTAMLAPWQNLELPAVTGANDGKPMHIAATQLLGTDGQLFNPFKSQDPELTELIDKAYKASSADASEEAWQAVTKKLVDLAWFVPIATGSYMYFANPKLQGVNVTPKSFVPDATKLYFEK